MSRITGTDALGLVEAYNAVYAPRQLTEEQIWEEVENWVYSLLDEGYDLSDYTWDELYEEYLSEMGGKGQMTTGQRQAQERQRAQNAERTKAQGQVKTALAAGRGIDVRGATTGVSQGRGYQAELEGRTGVLVRGGNVSKGGMSRPDAIGGTQPITVGGKTLYPAAKGKDIIYLPGKGASTKPTPAPAPAPAAAPRPTTTAAAPAPRPAPTSGGTAAAPRPAPTSGGTTAAPRPAPTSGGTTPATPAAPARTPNPLMQRTFGYQTGQGPTASSSAASTPTPSRPTGPIIPGREANIERNIQRGQQRSTPTTAAKPPSPRPVSSSPSGAVSIGGAASSPSSSRLPVPAPRSSSSPVPRSSSPSGGVSIGGAASSSSSSRLPVPAPRSSSSPPLRKEPLW